jgi:benzylsuccinate CoA-transferase BbsE subunit
VNTPCDLVESPQLQAREFFVDVAHPELGTSMHYPGAPYALSATPWQMRRRPPLLGEHNEEIYVHELGLRHDDLAVLRANGTI